MGREIFIQYYAVLREVRGVSEETILTSADTPRELYNQLQKLYELPLSLNGMSVAINNRLAAWSAPLNARDTVVFLPPFSRG